MASSSALHALRLHPSLRDDSLYIGETDDIEDRIARHQEGRVCAYTAARLPVDLVYIEELANRLAARRREHQLKGWTRKKEALVAGDLAALKRLSHYKPGELGVQTGAQVPL